MTITFFQTDLTDTTYNGWANYETWNVALWLQNDEGLYNLAFECGDYETLVNEIGVGYSTPDGVKFNDPKINRIEMNEMLQDL